MLITGPVNNAINKFIFPHQDMLHSMYETVLNRHIKIFKEFIGNNHNLLLNIFPIYIASINQPALIGAMLLVNDNKMKTTASN